MAFWPKTPIASLMPVGGRMVGDIPARVVADELDACRLDRLMMLGVDEVSHGAGIGSRPVSQTTRARRGWCGQLRPQRSYLAGAP